LILVACGQQPEVPSSTFVLPYSVEQSDQALTDLMVALVPALRAEGAAEDPFPMAGQILETPDQTDPSAKVLSCVQNVAADENASPCILLDEAGDFVHLQAITWQSQVFFMYRFYFTPSQRQALDPTQNFVALDPMLQATPSLYEPVQAAIQSASKSVGAVPFNPESSG
jgi:hypothetical protein